MSTNSIIDQSISDEVITQAIKRRACKQALEAARQSTWQTLPRFYQEYAAKYLDLPQEVKDYLFSLGHARTYWKDGFLHRDNDLPAVEYVDGTKEWWRMYRRHRDGDLPAKVHPDGTMVYYKEGKLHRDNDLPAIIQSYWNVRWFKNGIEYTPSL